MGLWISVSGQILIDALASSRSCIRVWGSGGVEAAAGRTQIVTPTLGPSTGFSVAQLVDNHLLLSSDIDMLTMENDKSHLLEYILPKS